MDINKRAEEILSKYIKPHRKVVYVPKIWLRQVIKRHMHITSGGQTVIFGYKEDVERFMQCLPVQRGTIRAEYAEPKDWINRPGKEFNNTELIKEIASWQIDKLIIVSENLRYLLQMYLIGEEVSYQVVDLYEIMKKEYGMAAIRGIAKNQIKNIIYDFLTECTKWGKRIWKVQPIKYCDSYDAILVKKHYARKANDSKEKAYYLKEVIINYLMIKDYQNAFLYIDEYVSLFGTYDNSFVQLKQEFMELFSQMKEYLHNKSEKDIIIFWCDALPYEDCRKWNFLEQLEKDSLVFENAYTHIPYTHTTSQSMFIGTPYFESKMYRSVETETMIEHGKTFDLLEENHYQICEIGDNYTNKKYLKPDSCYVRSLYPPATLRLWETLAQMLNGEEKKFIICHMDDELHNPYWNGESDRLRVEPGNFLTDISRFEIQRKESAAYLEKQILYYMDFLSENTCKIFMSDHGIGGAAYLDRRLHAFCFVQDNNVMKGKYKKFFSYLNFYELIQYILSPTQTNFESIFSDYILIQNDHPYSEKYCEEILSKLENHEDVPRVKWMGFRGIIKDGYKFLYFPDGVEMWFDQTEQEINPEHIPDQALVEFMRKNVGSEFPDISAEKHYAETKKLYDALHIN